MKIIVLSIENKKNDNNIRDIKITKKKKKKKKKIFQKQRKLKKKKKFLIKKKIWIKKIFKS